MLEDGARIGKMLDFTGFWLLRPMAAASACASLPAQRSSIRGFMQLSRLARSALSLLVAYAILAGGLLGASFGRAADPLSQICSFGAAEPGKGPGPAPSPHEAPDCCPALCGGQAVMLPPAIGLERAVRFASGTWQPRPPASAQALYAQFWLARAPPAG